MLCCAGILADGLHCGVSVWMLMTQQCLGLGRSGCGFCRLMADRPALRPADRTPPPLLDVFAGKLATQALFSCFLTSSYSLPPPFPLLYVCICHPSASPLALHGEQSLGSKVRLCLSLLSIPSQSISLCPVNRPPPPRPVCTVCVPVTGWSLFLFSELYDNSFLPQGLGFWCTQWPLFHLKLGPIKHWMWFHPWVHPKYLIFRILFCKFSHS